MTLITMVQNLEMIKKYEVHPRNMRLIKSYLTNIEENFDWETMSKKDIEQGFNILYKAISIYTKMRFWTDKTGVNIA